MSADLLEAFGSAQASQSPNEPSSSPVPWAINGVTQQQRLSHGRSAANTGLSASFEHTTRPTWETDEGGEVLFDATTAEDDFGEFAVPTHPEIQSPSLSTRQNETDLLALEDVHLDTNPRRHIQSKTVLDDIEQPSTSLIDVSPVSTFAAPPDHGAEHDEGPADDWGAFEDVISNAPKAPLANTSSHHITAVQAVQADEEEEDWDTFEDGPTIPSSSSSQVRPATAAPSTTQTEQQAASPVKSSKPHERPTNIPPPFTLLQLLPTVYQQIAAQSKSTPDPSSSIPVAQIILQTYRVTARIISGRSHRWTRDTRLSQSMRISEAGGVKKSGMKLTALDKGESIKEDQQAIEVVSAWSKHAHVLNSCMARAKIQRPPISLSQNMNVRVASGPGVLAAKEVCAVCGLKRNERVLGIDLNVEDSFGEFWVEFWGHRDCYGFWYGFEGLLDRR